MAKKILVTCAHPDDESLGMGGSLLLHSKNKDEIFVLVFTDGELSRGSSQKNVKKSSNKVEDVLGTSVNNSNIFIAYYLNKIRLIDNL